jgi:hypothetical protein
MLDLGKARGNEAQICRRKRVFPPLPILVSQIAGRPQSSPAYSTPSRQASTLPLRRSYAASTLLSVQWRPGLTSPSARCHRWRSVCCFNLVILTYVFLVPAPMSVSGIFQSPALHFRYLFPLQDLQDTALSATIMQVPIEPLTQSLQDVYWFQFSKIGSGLHMIQSRLNFQSK